MLATRFQCFNDGRPKPLLPPATAMTAILDTSKLTTSAAKQYYSRSNQSSFQPKKKGGGGGVPEG